jgi:hypothetical protein
MAKAPVKKAAPAPAFEDEPGVSGPLGFWDPLGFTKGLTPESPKYKRWRAVEYKHGRISMLAVIGIITPNFFKFPGLLSSSQNLAFADVPAGVDGLFSVPAAGIAQIVAFIGLLETTVFAQVRYVCRFYGSAETLLNRKRTRSLEILEETRG